jgi:hypothetical protein
MRRLTLVAPAAGPEDAGLAATLAWLDTLPLAGVERVDRLDQATLDRTELLWLRDETTAAPTVAAPTLAAPTLAAPTLLAWLRAGGRLFATHTGARVAAALGLTPHPPSLFPLSTDGAADFGSADFGLTDFGLAGFGAHPLFVGLRDGATTGRPGSGDRLCGYPDGLRPGAGGAVAMARYGLAVEPATLLAWELEVGAGGLLCLAFEPALSPGHPPSDAEVVLANAIVGEAIPHRDRAVAAAVWPAAGRQALEAPLASLAGSGPSGPPDPWPPSVQPRLDLTPSAEWVHAGRRALVAAGAGAGQREVWVFPCRVMHEAMVRDAIACAPGHLAADEVAGGLALGGIRLLERWLAAADVPVVVWELSGPAGVELAAEWSVDLRRAWPYGPGAYGDLRYALGDDGTSLRVESAGGPAASFTVHGGRLEARGSIDAPVVRVVCRGATPLRIVISAGADQGELTRAVQALTRDGVAGLAAARGRQADQLRRFGTAFESADGLLASGLDWARQRGDEAVMGVPGVGRSVLTACHRHAGATEWCFSGSSWPAAAALLAVGHRDPARELLRFLAQSAHPSGGIPGLHPLGGLASAPDVPGTAGFLALAARLLAWTGDEATIQSLAPALRGALAYLGRAGSVPPASVLEPLDATADRDLAELIAGLRPRASAEPLAEPAEPHAIVQAAAAALRRAPGAIEGGGAATALLEAVVRLWGLEPDAVEGTLAVRPALPPGWDRFALRRLRVGRTLLDLELRRRGPAVVVRAIHRFGPSLVLTVGVHAADIAAIELDDEPLAGGRARFELRGRHEVRFQLR